MSDFIIPAASTNGQSSLETIDRQKLQSLEAEAKPLESGAKRFIAILVEIHDTALYKYTHQSFDDYLREKWNISRQYYYKLAGPQKPMSRQLDAAPATSPPQPTQIQSSGVKQKPKEKPVKKDPPPAKKEEMNLNQAIMLIGSRSVIDQRKAMVKILGSHDHIAGKGIWVLVGEDLKYYNNKKK